MRRWREGWFLRDGFKIAVAKTQAVEMMSLFTVKEAFFLEDFPNYGLGGGSYGCSPVSQGISVGYNDTYGSHLTVCF